MKMQDVQWLAKERGLKPGRLKKTELVRAIQQAEGNQNCFQTGLADNCGQEQCLWRHDCF